jgi:hypothetical protein
MAASFTKLESLPPVTLLAALLTVLATVFAALPNVLEAFPKVLLDRLAFVLTLTFVLVGPHAIASAVNDAMQVAKKYDLFIVFLFPPKES